MCTQDLREESVVHSLLDCIGAWDQETRVRTAFPAEFAEEQRAEQESEPFDAIITDDDLATSDLIAEEREMLEEIPLPGGGGGGGGGDPEIA